MKSIFALVTGFAVLVLAADAQSNCGKCGKEKASAEKASAEQSAATCDASKGCPIAAALERLPKLTYSVGDKATCCPKEAATLAKESGGHIHFVVAGEEYDSEADARAALIEATEEFVADFAKPHTCPTSGTVTLAGQKQSCAKTAAATAEKMKEAMAGVKFTYLVGEEECSCPIKAAALAKESGKEKFIVVGDEKTCCEKTARLNLARAKYFAAVKAMLAAQASAETPKAAQAPDRQPSVF